MHGPVPSPSCQNVAIVWLPLDAEDSVVVVAQVPSLELLRLSLVEQPAVDLPQLTREGVVSSLRADLARLKHLVVLPGEEELPRSCMPILQRAIRVRGEEGVP